MWDKAGKRDKTIRFPNDAAEAAENEMKGKDCAFSAFALAAVHKAPEDLNRGNRASLSPRITDPVKIMGLFIFSPLASLEFFQTASLHWGFWGIIIDGKEPGNQPDERTVNMANEDQKDFNAMLHKDTDMPKTQTVTDEKTINRYGGEKMFFAPPMAYDEIMKTIPQGKLLTVGQIRDYLAKKNGADFTDPITAGIFVSIAAWASHQRTENETPYWRVLKAGGELNPKYPGGAEAQKEKLEAEGHIVAKRGRTHIKYYVENYEDALLTLT